MQKEIVEGDEGRNGVAVRFGCPSIVCFGTYCSGCFFVSTVFLFLFAFSIYFLSLVWSFHVLHVLWSFFWLVVGVLSFLVLRENI